MTVQDSFHSQYHAAFDMLQQVVERCPDALWVNRSYRNPTWAVCYHTLFFTHLYLGQSMQAFVPWLKHRPPLHRLIVAPEAQAYTRADILEYLAFCRDFATEQLPALHIDAPSGFDWLAMNKLELQAYSIRHLAMHTGELCERLGARGDCDVEWVYTGPR